MYSIFILFNDVALLLRTRMLADARNHKQLRLKHDPTALEHVGPALTLDHDILDTRVVQDDRQQ